MNTRLAVTIAEACAAAGIGRTSLYKAIGSGELRAVKCGRRTLLLPDDLARWLRGRPNVMPQSRSDQSVIVRG